VATPLREQGPGYFHVYTRATGAGALAVDDVDRRLLTHLLVTTSDRLEWRLHAYCVMTTHYHAVVETVRPDLSRGMQRVNSTYAKAFNHRHGRFGTLVACRFGYRVIEGGEYMAEVCKYVFGNPVRAHLCKRPTGWPWSGGRLFHLAAYL
jgi:putative transposase